MSQIFVYGESLKSCIIAIVIPEVDTVKFWALQKNIPGTLSVLCANSEIKTLILDDMLLLGKYANLKSFEQVSKFYGNKFFQSHKNKSFNKGIQINQLFVRKQTFRNFCN